MLLNAKSVFVRSKRVEQMLLWAIQCSHCSLGDEVRYIGPVRRKAKISAKIRR